ncbi:endolytic transglycosylase MltG [Candidatus Gottesmanbacteria bacterium]|nr:endolytic transglycosylase MltG [Candidatus Gottesmanbacteria bacterium]
MERLLVRIVVFLLIATLFIGGGVIWYNDALSPAGPGDSQSRIFVVQEGENVRSIATRLKNEKLIKNQIGFFLRVKLLKSDNKLQAGDFRLSSAMDVDSIIKELTHGTLDVWVRTVEGWRSEEIALKLAKDLSIPESEFLKHAEEGYMFPDTYLIPKDASTGAVVKIMLDNFEGRVSSELRRAIETQGFNLEEGIILASIVEREGRTDEDRPIIAGILIKRLHNDWPLQADATLQYALGYQPIEKTWWKKYLTEYDKKIDSPYNTYIQKGLPEKPISNPGLSAITAVAYPNETEYWYYLHDTEGKVHYAVSNEEHNANIAKYLQ